MIRLLHSDKSSGHCDVLVMVGIHIFVSLGWLVKVSNNNNATYEALSNKTQSAV